MLIHQYACTSHQGSRWKIFKIFKVLGSAKRGQKIKGHIKLLLLLLNGWGQEGKEPGAGTRGKKGNYCNIMLTFICNIMQWKSCTRWRLQNRQVNHIVVPENIHASSTEGFSLCPFWPLSALHPLPPPPHPHAMNSKFGSYFPLKFVFW